MAKDPAVLWYFNDWQGGTITFSRHLKGCYMDLLHAQFNGGHLTLQEIETVLGTDFGSWPALSKKFARDENGLFFNERLETEMLRRKKYTKSRHKNLAGKKKKVQDKQLHLTRDVEPHMEPHMENENEIENTSTNENEILSPETEIDIWKQPLDFLKHDEQWWNETILMKVKLPPETVEFALTQYWFNLQKDNKRGNLQMLRAGFRKWLNTWQQIEKKEAKNEQLKNTRKGQPDTAAIDAAADRILEEHARNKKRGGGNTE